MPHSVPARLLLEYGLCVLTVCALRLAKHAHLSRFSDLGWTLLAAALLSIAMLGLGVATCGAVSLLRRNADRFAARSTAYAMIETIAIALLMLLQG
jgi:hypothetical protein